LTDSVCEFVFAHWELLLDCYIVTRENSGKISFSDQTKMFDFSINLTEFKICFIFVP